MNTKHLVITGIIAVVLSLAAVQAFALPQYYGWGPMSMMGNGNGHMNHGNGCNMMNGQGMMGNMHGQQMNYQQCQQHMGPNGMQMMNGQYQQQHCLQHMDPSHNLTPEQCQAMYQYCHG